MVRARKLAGLVLAAGLAAGGLTAGAAGAASASSSSCGGSGSVTTVNAALQRVPARSVIATQSLSAAPGNVLAMVGVIQWLELNGYNRTSTVRDADQIVVLVDGKISERGTHDELLATGGYYADLYHKQLLEEELERA